MSRVLWGRGKLSHRISHQGDWRGSEVRPKATAYLGTVFPLSMCHLSWGSQEK